ncbi:MAG: T9SS type A sorting domain-containing protein [Ignavibacteriales bacterium]|nr:T9SS type A sorting domain-containing protein [Ignavibacteriales bacterium]
MYKFSMSGGAFNPVPEVITLSNNAFGGSASVAPLPDGSFYYNAAGKNVMKYSATGTIIDTIPGTVVATGTNSIQYLGSINRTVNEYILTFAYGAGNENGFMATIPDGDPNFATFYGKTPTLGTNSNANGTGDVAYMFNNDGTLTVFTLSSNNGFGAYKLLNAVPVELASFNATANVNNVNVDWVTSTETNSADFIIERKSSNGNWQSAGSVKAAGTSTSSRAYSFIDKNVATGKYSYRLKQIDFDGSTTTFNAIEVEVGVPAVFDLSQNYPNPFNPSTRVNFSLPTPSNVTLDVFDISGQKVATILSGYMTAGYHTADIDAQKLKLSSGIYIYKLSAGKFTSTKKMILMK